MVKVEEPNKYDLKTFKTNFKLNKETGNFILRAEDLEIGYNEKKIAKINIELYKVMNYTIIVNKEKKESDYIANHFPLC